MCTALVQNQIFGRTMDLPALSSPWELTYLPPHYQFTRYLDRTKYASQYGILGGMRVTDGEYLIGDGINTAGLVMAELYYKCREFYAPAPVAGQINLAPQDLIEWCLAHYGSVAELAAALPQLTLVSSPWFDTHAYVHEFHWLVADQTGTYLIEPAGQELTLRRLTIPVITNAPSYDQHQQRLINTVDLDADLTDLELSLLKNVQLPASIQTSRTPSARWMRTAVAMAQSRPITEILKQVQMEHLPGHDDYTHYWSTIDLATQTYTYHDVDQHRTKMVPLPKLHYPSPHVFHFKSLN